MILFCLMIYFCSPILNPFYNKMGFTPGEGELLFGPLSYLEVIGEPKLELFEDQVIIVLNVKININLKALTIEEMIGRRQQSQIVTVENLMKELKFDLKILQVDCLEDELESAIKSLSDLVEKAHNKGASWFNEDQNFRSFLNDSLDEKQKAITLLYSNWLNYYPQV
jgi:hypothetical protein